MRSQRGVAIAFAALCLLAGSRWLVDSALPSPLAPGVRASLHFALLAAVLALLSALRGRRIPARAGNLTLLGAILFGLATTGLAQARGGFDGGTVELAFLLLPLGTLFTLAQTGDSAAGESARSLLLPTLAGVGGAMLLLPWATPVTWAGWLSLLALCAGVVLSGVLVVKLHVWLQGQAVLSAGMLIAAGAAFLSAFTAGWRGTGSLTLVDWLTEAAVVILLDGPVLILGVWCLRELPPMRFSLRPLLSLLVAIVESFLSARPAIAGLQRWTMFGGALLMVGSAVLIWREGVRSSG